ncbi:hypothetical protein ACIHAA_17570 [Streptomyces sp. NPDC052040]|uniref:hypothetical protein n=1 Tax=Streptomyces sp. NPDC052040 TaxID=3365682 RepID=UPI0037CE7626
MAIELRLYWNRVGLYSIWTPPAPQATEGARPGSRRAGALRAGSGAVHNGGPVWRRGPTGRD